MSYRKREIAHWNQGKGCKGTRKAKERAFVCNEIDQQVAEQDPDFKYRHSKRKINKVAKLEHWVSWCERQIAEYGIQKNLNSSFVHWIRDSLNKAKKQLEEIKNALRT